MVVRAADCDHHKIRIRTLSSMTVVTHTPSRLKSQCSQPSLKSHKSCSNQHFFDFRPSRTTQLSHSSLLASMYIDYAKRLQSRICNDRVAMSKAARASKEGLWFSVLAGSLTLRTRSMFLEGSLQRARRIVTCSSGSEAFPNFLTSCVPVSKAGVGVADG